KMEENDGTGFCLKYPNFEVQKYLTKGILAHITDGKVTAGDSKKLVSSLAKNNFKGFAVTLNACLTGIPYQWHKYDLASYEAWYASLLYMGFLLLDVDLRVEESSSHGRSDMVLLEEKQAFVFEFKVVNSAAAKDKAVTAAIKQIEEKGYAKKYMEQEQDQKIEAVYAIALVFGKKEKNVVGWKAKALLS
ncbi:MAG: PD-(D/E)XK nuclease domain-containing protein, partial [Proteobacteria bacterium]|nr:PD-(D/E)XK nuclease domain-containing protein [Pseudomonadota bacterium]